MEALTEYKEFARALAGSRIYAHRPPRKPDNSQRRVGRNVRGRIVWRKQILLQDVPTAQVKKTENRRIRVIREENSFWGLLRKL